MASIHQKILLAFSAWAGTALAANECAASATTQTRTLSLPSSRPSDAIAVRADFVGFGFETAFLNDYANNFSENLVTVVADRTSLPPVIRIGGTSGDKVLFDPNQEAIRVCINGECPLGSNAQYILGPSYFDGFKKFPNAKMTFQAPLGPDTNNSESLKYVRRAYKALGTERVTAIALGNEPNFYDKTAAEYSNTSKGLASDIIKDLGLSDPKVFQVGNIANGGVLSGNPWTLQDAFKAGLNSDHIAKSAAAHYYQVTGKEPFEKLQATLMNHTAMTSHLTNFVKSITYLRNNFPNVPYILPETGSSIGSHPLNYSNAFGSTLWSAAFQLAAMTRRVGRINMTQRPVAMHSLWVPNDSASGKGMPGPSVRAPFTAQPFVADFIGKGGSSVVEVLGNPLATAYAAFGASGSAERIAIVNLRLWYEGCGGPRGAMRFDVGVGAGAKATLKRLHAGSGVTAMGFDIGGPGENITWAGEQWTYKVDQGKGHVSGPTEETLPVTDGAVTITVPDSEAVILYLG